MCGIAGIVGPAAEGEALVLAAMIGRIAHRGPDDEGLWTSEDVCLAHRRLSILDLSAAGHQPMQTPDGRYTITFNGEIYNYRELRAELEARGCLFQSGTDTEVILAAWREWGESCTQRFNGMWAFAIWDNERRLLFASRDRFGKKPFYFAQYKGRFYFASEIKALLAIPGIGRTLNMKPLAEFCIDRVLCDAEETLIHEIKPLPPATSLIWHAGRMLQKSYWNFPADDSGATGSIDNPLAALLEDAVRIRLRADTPVGCLVSGGLDSSAIAALMRRQTGERPVHLFTTRTQPAVDEIKGVELLLSRGGYVPHWHTPDARLFWKDLPALVWHQESPFADGSMAAHFALMREARHAGIPVLLTGQGADEVLAGYPTFLWRWIGSLVRHGEWAKARAALAQVRAQQTPRYGAIAFHALPRRLRRMLRHLRTPAPDWLSPDVRAAASSIDRWEDAGSAHEELNAAQRSAMARWTLPGFLQYEDRNAMAFGVETRLPYLDYRIVEALWAISVERRLEGGRTKALLREAAHRWLPAQIVNRTAKEGYPAPLARWLKSLESEVRDTAAGTDFRQCPLLEHGAWTRRLDRFMAGDTRELEAVWRGLISALWYQRFIKGSSS